MKNEKNRRAFMDTVAKTAFGAAIIGVLPARLSGRSSGSAKKANVKIHPMAVKRNNKG